MKKPLLAIAALLLALAACVTTGSEVKPSAEADAGPVAPVDAGPPDAGPPDPRAAVPPLRAEAKALLHTQSELYWKNWTTGEPIDVAATYAGHEALFGLPTIQLVSAAETAETDPVAKRALTFFKLYLSGEHIAKETALLSDQVANLEGRETFNTGAKDEPYRNLEVLLANEPSHEKRVALSKAALPVVAKLNPLLKQKEERTEALVGELGYPSYNALASQMRDVDLEALAQTAEQVLTSTEALYTRAMGEAVHRELRLELADMRRSDIPRFFHATSVQSAFPAEQMLPRLKALLSGLGIDLGALKNITIDDRKLDKKNPRAVCFPVEVPGDVRLSIKPMGGVDDYLQLYHEAGHALHFAHTTAPEWEFQQLGNNTVTEAYAFLLEDRLEDPRYLAELGMTGELLSHYVRSAAVKKLYMLRRYAAKVLFEKAWHAGGADPKARYAELLARAYAFPVPDEDAQRYLTDHDDFFYSADYLRAWFLAAQIDDALTQKFGPTWWHDPKAGEALKALWAHGNQLTADEVARALGLPGLDTAPLLKRLESRLAPAGK